MQPSSGSKAYVGEDSRGGTVRAEDEAFESLVRGSTESLLRTALLLTGNRTDAEDLLQLTYFKIYVGWQRLEAGRDPAPYLRRILLNTHRSRARRFWSRETPVDLTMADRPTVTDQSRFVFNNDALLAALLKLPVRQRAAVVLRYCEDQSEAQTARVMNCSIGAVKSQTSRGISRLRVLLEQDPPPRTIGEGDHDSRVVGGSSQHG